MPAPPIRFAWETVAPAATGPGSRSRHCLAADSVARTTVLFGGIVWADGGRLLGDTWELRAGRWARVTGPESPSARHRGAMTFDPDRGQSVLFGGQDGSGRLLGDTWTYAAGRWRRRRGWWWAARPAARCGHCLAFDEGLGAVVLFGGIGRGDRPLADTWLFDGRAWRRVPGPGPTARRYAAMAYDPGLEGCVLHGGAEDDRGRRLFGDTWLFRGNAWTRLGPGFDTDARDDHAMGYHRAAGRLVMLDGVNGARGLLARESAGWQPARLRELHPRLQCSPLVWDEVAGGLLFHGGETHHGGAQFGATLVLKLAG